MRRMGYKELTNIYDARDFGGLTSRKRAYCMFSCLPEPLIAPETIERNTNSIWPIVEEHWHELRDITETQAIIKGKDTGRLRIITRDSTCAPTFLKSQNRQCKDMVAIEHEDRYYMPSEKLMAKLMGIDMNFDAVSKTIESEIIGQSVESPMSNAVIRAVKQHIDNYFVSFA